jgi:hypothetical protein
MFDGPHGAVVAATMLAAVCIIAFKSPHHRP